MTVAKFSNGGHIQIGTVSFTLINTWGNLYCVKCYQPRVPPDLVSFFTLLDHTKQC